VTYNFDTAFDAAMGELVRRYEEMLIRLDIRYDYGGETDSHA
jgi:hypothetical protein